MVLGSILHYFFGGREYYKLDYYWDFDCGSLIAILIYYIGKNDWVVVIWQLEQQQGKRVMLWSELYLAKM